MSMLVDILHTDNRRILNMIACVKDDVRAADALPENRFDPALAERLDADARHFVGLFTHYKLKERLLLPHLENQGAGDEATEAWSRDDLVRTYISMALMLLPGAHDRPSSGNLQSVAAQLADACEEAATALAEEEAELFHLARTLLSETDRAQMDARIPKVAPARADDPTTWAVSPLELAEARLEALGM